MMTGLRGAWGGAERRAGWAAGRTGRGHSCGLQAGLASVRGRRLSPTLSPLMRPLSSVCRKFLLAHPEERARLWEVEPPGAWGQRGSIWLKVQLQQAGPPAPELA